MNILNIAGRLAVRITFACIATCAVIPNASADRANWQTHPDQTPGSDLSQPQGNWVLMETKLSKSNPYDSGYWKHTPSGGNGNAAFTVRGAKNEYTRTSASWSEPPARPKAGERFHINLTAKVEALTNRPGAHVVVDAYIDVPGLALGHRTRGAQRLVTTEGKQSCEAYTESTQCSVVGALPTGVSSTDKQSLYVSAYNEGMLVINEYVYAWLPAPPPIKPSAFGGGDSAVRFASISGTVEVAYSIEDVAADRWHFAKMGMVIPNGLYIRTGEESGCILSFSDMSTFVLAPESMIVITRQEDPSKLALVAGRVWNNFKRMLKDGSMEIETSQAAMSIKGTTLVLEDTGSTSTLKVIEGAVEFKPRKGGVSTLVTGGNMISATARGADAMRRFDVAAENRYWATLTDDIRNGRLRGKPGRLGKGSASVPSLLGTWNWTCCRGRHRDTFTITEHRADGTIRGIFGAQDGNSTPLQGTFKAGVMQFTRHLDIAGRKETQEWRAQIQVQGDVTQTVDGRWSGFAASADNTDFHARLSTGQSTLGAGAVNLARGKPASQSSTSEWSRRDDAQGAVDGVINGSYAFHTSNQANPWWQVDLGGQASIDEVRIFNRLDCCGERARTLQVMLSDDARQWRTVYRHGGGLFGGKDGKPLKVTLSGASARYVRLQLNEANWFHLDEVEVYGRMGDSVSMPGGRDYTGHDSPIATPDSRPGSGYLRIEACVDGSDWISLDNGRLNHQHRAFDQIGTHG
ncbi:MAG: FkbM family methyltransferase, partial [bacterium]